jgi:hypothetical protein
MERRNGGSRTQVSTAERKVRAHTLNLLLESTLASMKEVAQKLPLGRGIADRLMANSSAQSAWRSLLQRNVTADAIPEELRLRHWDLNERGVSVVQQACVAVFAYVVIEFSLPRPVRPVGTGRDWERLAASYRDAAQLCRGLLCMAPHPSPEDAAALQRAATYIENFVSWQRQHRDNAYVVGKRSNRKRGFNDDTRGRTRALAEVVRAIYGRRLNRVVGTIAAVALNTKEITPQSVINWAAE